MKIQSIDYSDWYINQKSIPDKESEEYIKFFEYHKEFCLNGAMMNGTFINPFLYWHLNFWHTEVDIIDDRNRVNQKYATPLLRDNEWIVTNEIHRAHEEQKGLVILGIRRFGKSVLEASYIGWGATFDENSQNVIAGLNSPDIKLITDKLDKGLNFIPEAWRWQRVEDNWKNQVTLGIKTRAGERIPFSQILIRNLDEGNNEEAIAGTKPRKLIIDEIGKGNYLRALQAAIPGFTTPYGWGCSPLLVGCVCAGTKVWNNKGDLINIENVIPEEGIIGYSNGSFSKETITYWQPPKEVECYRIETHKGTVLECSYNHPILYRSRDERYMVPISTGKRKGYRKMYFKETQDLKIGNQIGLIEEVPIFGENRMWEPRLIGWLIGDGSYGKDKTPIMSNCDEEINNYITNNFNTVIERSHITKDGKEYRETRIKEICPILRAHGIYGQTKDKKTLPLYIHSYQKHDICELLGGLFDTDGSISHNIKTPPCIYLSAAHKNILLEVKLLLQKIGIHSNITFHKPKLKNVKDKNGYYRLNVIDRKSIQKFHSQITFFLGYKQEKLEKTIILLENRKNKIPEETVGIRFEKIVSIEKIGKKPVYNLTAGISNTYIANGIITHNTGGDMSKFQDAKSLMFDVDNFNFLTYNNEDDEKRVHGLFMSYKYRMEAKEPSTLGKFLEAPVTSGLHKVPMLVSNLHKAMKITQDNLDRTRKAGDRIAYLKEKMYYPIKVDDIFLNEDTNIFDIEAAKRQKIKLLNQERTGIPVILYNNEGRISHEFTDKLPITNYPLRATDDKDAPIVIYEFPVENPPYGLYVAGVDPYRQGQSAYSSSLGSVYIYKRMHDITSEKYQDMFVASYCARPAKKDTWEEQARLLIKYYNARTLCENDDISFIEYMKAKGDAHYLEKQPQWLLEIVPNTTVKREYGVHRSAQKIIDYLHNCYKHYMEEIVYTETDEDGKLIKEIVGVNRILDPVLLEETIQYNNTGNFDRIVAAELAIAQAIKMDPIMGRVGGAGDERINALFRKRANPTLFPGGRNMFNRKKNKLFI
jgi:hypothetical protein